MPKKDVYFARMPNSKKNKLAILGCGWLGLPLAQSFVNAGWLVNGSTTRPEKLSHLGENGIQPFLINLGAMDAPENLRSFLEADVLIVNVPPGRPESEASTYQEKMEVLATALRQSLVKKVMFISSTSVYADNCTVHTEESLAFADSNSGKRMMAAEQVFNQLPNVQYTVVRFGGLINEQRHPGRFFNGKTAVANGLAPVNLIHLDDCIGIIDKIINNNLWGQTFNAVAPSHPDKETFYTLATQKYGGISPSFIREKLEFKIISSDKILKTGYRFKHPDLLNWLKETDK